MPGPADIPRGNIGLLMSMSVAVPSGSALAANTTEERTYSVPGLLTTDYVNVSKPTFQAGVFIANVRVSAAGVLAITFGNCTAGTPTLTAETYGLVVGRGTNPGIGPTALV
jgi:hypothetical protein